MNPSKKPKSDLTLGFMNSSDQVNSLAIQSLRAAEIDRMRQNAVRHQPTKPVSRHGRIAPTRSRLQFMEKLGDDPAMAHPNTSPVPIPSPRDSTTLRLRPSRTMTSASFKNMYSGLARKNSPGGKTKPNSHRTVLMHDSIKSQFSPGPDSYDGITEFIKEGPEHQSCQ